MCPPHMALISFTCKCQTAAPAPDNIVDNTSLQHADTDSCAFCACRGNCGMNHNLLLGQRLQLLAGQVKPGLVADQSSLQCSTPPALSMSWRLLRESAAVHPCQFINLDAGWALPLHTSSDVLPEQPAQVGASSGQTW